VLTKNIVKTHILFHNIKREVSSVLSKPRKQWWELKHQPLG